MHVYDVRELVKTYPGQARPANDKINLQIEVGEILGILGANGAGISALVGTAARTPQESGSISLLITLAMLGLGPVIIPPDRLPPITLVLGRFSPATYAASALRQVLLGPVTPRLVGDLAFLIGFSLAVFWLVGRRMDWRQR